MTVDAFGLRIGIAKLRDADTALAGKAEGKELLEILRLDKILKPLIKQLSLFDICASVHC